LFAHFNVAVPVLALPENVPLPPVLAESEQLVRDPLPVSVEALALPLSFLQATESFTAATVAAPAGPAVDRAKAAVETGTISAAGMRSALANLVRNIH
jgi:hypothetical protein